MACRNSEPKYGIKTAMIRGITVFCLASALAATFVTTYEVQFVSASARAATTVRHDRRPDRERPVTTSANSSGSGYSQNSSTSNASTQSRPRLVRR